jgi:hypothetical protein
MTIYWVYKKSRPITLKEVINVFDLGYLPWRRKGFPGTAIIHTYNRKKRNLNYFVEEKEYNKNNSRKKILIEHTISVDWKNIEY